MWIESDDDYRPVPGEWICDRLARLHATLRERDSGLRDRSPGRFLDPLPFYAAVARGATDEAVACVAARYGLDPARVELVWVSDLASDRVAAHVQSEPLGPIVITARAEYRQSPCGFGAVLAHELGHAYLTDMDVPNGGGWDEEATTDLVTFVVGLGKLTVNGVGHVQLGARAGSRCYGYLNREAVVFAYAQTALRYGVPRADARAGLNAAVLGYLRVLDDEPGWLRRLWDRVARWLGGRPAIAERDIAVDEAGHLVDRGTGERL